jgi:hypothetical protein
MKYITLCLPVKRLPSRAEFFFLTLGLLLLLSSAPAWGQISLTGLWVDSRTGRDFWEIEGDEQGFRFTAYGGNPASPRYLSRGVALALQPGHLNATVRDLPGHCCAQQARFNLRIINSGQMQAEGAFSAAAQPGLTEGKEEKAESFTLTRLGTGTAALPSPPLAPPSISYDPVPAPPKGQTSPVWQGSWQGDGWARFFIIQDGSSLKMFWYYSPQSPFFGLYQLDSSGLQASGIALAQIKEPGDTFYQHELTMHPETLRIELRSRRLAAPLEDGRWVTWKSNPSIRINLSKIADALPADELAILNDWFSRSQPRALLERTLKQAAQENKLLEREHE